MQLNKSAKCVVVLLVTTGQFYFFKRLGAPPSGQLTLLLVIINFTLVSTLEIGWRWYAKRRQQRPQPSDRQTISIEEEVEDENSGSH